MKREPTEHDFATIRSWGLDENPFRAVDDHSPLKEQLRWLNAENRQSHVEYWVRRLEWTEGKTFRTYYTKAEKPIDRNKWEYLKARKAWFIMPLGWDSFAKANIERILDLGCGDGDTTQRIADWIAERWKEQGHDGHALEIMGLDLNPSRIDNAKRLVTSPHPRISMQFSVADNVNGGIEYPDRCFDYVACTGVIEILDDADAAQILDEICRVAGRGVYIEDLADTYPGGYPRENLPKLVEQRGFETTRCELVLTEPFQIEGSSDPLELWPMQRDMNLFAERKPG